MWRYVLDDEAETVYLYRDDVPPSTAPAAGEETLPPAAAESYEAGGLAERLRSYFQRDRDRYTAHWDPAAQAAVVAELAQRDVAASFDDWWEAVGGRRWTPPPSRRGPGARSGSNSYTGYSDGGSTGASFGTPTF